MQENQLYLSIIVPFYNEEGNIKELHRRIYEAAQKIGRSFEIIFVDDGSSDGTLEEARSLAPLKLLVFRKNFGQTAAFDAGIKAARGEIIVTLDGDLQNDPADISLLLEKINAGYDVVSGWRFHRRDSFTKRFLSRGANLLRKILVQDGIHDSGCSLKAYRRECFRELDLFGEMHRFIPALLAFDGFRVAEVKVSHHPRIHGRTKYNWKRAVKGLVDMLFIWFWRKYSHRAVHLFGGSGILLGLAGTAILLWMFVEKIFYGTALAERIWPLVGTLLILVGVQLFIFGILVDVAVRTYYHTRHRMNYSIREIQEL
jgi:glycosyltransferase involved in cell wall biosynthesis